MKLLLNCIDGYQPAICSGVLSAGLYFSLPLVRIKAIRSSSDSAKAREFEYLVRNRMELSRNIRLERSKLNEASKASLAKDAQEKNLLLKYQREISESLEDAQYYREKARRTHIEFLNSSPYDETIRPTGEKYDRLARQATQHAQEVQQNKYFPLKALLEKGSPRPHHIAEENAIKSLGESISGLRMQRSEIIERARLVSIPDNLKKTIEWTIKTGNGIKTAGFVGVIGGVFKGLLGFSSLYLGEVKDAGTSRMSDEEFTQFVTGTAANQCQYMKNAEFADRAFEYMQEKQIELSSQVARIVLGQGVTVECISPKQTVLSFGSTSKLYPTIWRRYTLLHESRYDNPSADSIPLNYELRLYRGEFKPSVNGGPDDPEKFERQRIVDLENGVTPSKIVVRRERQKEFKDLDPRDQVAVRSDLIALSAFMTHSSQICNQMYSPESKISENIDEALGR